MDEQTYYFTLGQLMIEWYNSDGQQRFGQYVINSDRVKTVVQTPNPEIFYDQNPERVLRKLFDIGAQFYS